MPELQEDFGRKLGEIFGNFWDATGSVGITLYFNTKNENVNEFRICFNKSVINLFTKYRNVNTSPKLDISYQNDLTTLQDLLK